MVTTITTGGVDLAALLYLNPELAAFSNVGSLAAAAVAWASDQPSEGGPGALAGLASKLPSTPQGFDARVYLAAQPDVSGMNDTIRLAMLGFGMSEDAVARRGTYVATLMEDVRMEPPESCQSPSVLAFACEFGNEAFAFSPCNLRSGDRVRLQRHGGRADVYHGRVVRTNGGSNVTIDVESAPAFLDGGGAFTLCGIRIHDAERQALVAFARNGVGGGSGGAIDRDDVVPNADFDLDTYRAVYPETRGMSLQDAYIDYRTRWKHRSEYRVIRGRDMFNLAAPYTSNLLGGTAEGQSLLVFGDFSSARTTMRVSTSNSYFDDTLLVGSGFFLASPSNLSVGSTPPVPLAGPGPVGAWWSDANAFASLPAWLLATRAGSKLLSVFEDDGRTPCIAGGAVDLCCGNLHVTPTVVSAAGGAVVVTRAGDLVAGGDASNLAVLNSNCVASMACGYFTVSASNAAVRDVLNVGAAGTGLGRVGIGMPCIGDEGARPSDWVVGNSDPANFAMTTRLAVAGDIFATGTVVTLSDARAKKDVRPIEGALDRVMRMRGYTYASTDLARAPRRHTGLLAHEVRAAMPEAVYRTSVPSIDGVPEGEDACLSSVAYGNLVGLLVEAIRELNGKLVVT